MNFLGLDLGASSLKASLINADGQVLASARAPVKTAMPQPGWAEQNPEDWLAALASVLTELRTHHADALQHLAGISVTAGTHIAVLCDAAGQPLRPAILWSDQRAADIMQSLETDAAEITALSLHRPNPTWTLAHLKWLSEYEPATLAATRHLLPAKDWLRRHLTATPAAETATDLSDAVGSQLYDAATGKPAPQLCEIAGITPDILPPVHEATAMAGTLDPALAGLYDLPADIPVYVGAIDTSAELLAAGVTQSGQATLKLASAGVLSVCVDSAMSLPPVSCYPQAGQDCYPQAGQGWYLAAGMNSCTTALDWLAENFLNAMPLQEMTDRAAGLPIGAEGVMFHPYLQGERAPHWDPDLTACLSGLTRGAGHGHIARAGFEGIAMALLDIRRDMQKHFSPKDKTALKTESKTEIKEFVLLGGGAQNAFWGQMIADSQNSIVHVPASPDAAYGAALLAAMGQGKITRADIPGIVQFTASYRPDPAAHKQYEAVFQRYDQLRQKL